MKNSDAMSLSAALLAATGSLVEDIHNGVVALGYTDLRPTHGFVFSRLAPSGATVTEIAEHLGVTRQAASQIVDELERKEYVERRPHPDDARARLVVLTPQGRRCTRAAEESAAEAVQPWIELLGEERLLALRDELVRLAPTGPIRPSW
ncbi:MarR family winged helix-turn-helix transcriptional regulator [Streptomyces sp. CBMA29]|uniref:MarR family winged helix-turn-helix transcriptional regulator n=1 Tax=Streptomyces sp. CBMA29 TaxID=1896314 RepID=UPI0016621B6E|nr:MarR family transcriptional regulator [Streptomyces sp. CBMA29]MBD0738343.1 MarR family transcriptional regulator [Streptomyces sp. CBMA29]